MSTNSNEADDFLQEYHGRQTKLERFLRLLDQDTVKRIDQYLQSHKKPSSDLRSDKIKLYEDLLIIRMFKEHESSIAKKKIIDQLCQLLKNQINYSVATIRQRIQKKLSGVNKQDIINHIKLSCNFTFNSKRKLMPLKLLNKKTLGENQFIELEDGDLQSSKRGGDNEKSSKQSKVISINSSAGESEGSVEEIPKPIIKFSLTSNLQDLKKTSKAKSQIPKPQKDVAEKQKKKQKAEQFNQFRMWSDHSSDQQILLVKEESGYKISTKKAEQTLQQIMEMVEKQCMDIKHKKGKTEQPPDSMLATVTEKINQISANLNRISNSINNTQDNKKSEPQNQSQYSNKKELDKNKPCVQKNEMIVQFFEQEDQPEPQQLLWYCSLEDWKLAKSDSKFSNLRWFSDEDEFLRKAVASEKEQSEGKLQVLKKFKNPANILNRIKYLQLNPPSHIITNLIGNSG